MPRRLLVLVAAAMAATGWASGPVAADPPPAGSCWDYTEQDWASDGWVNKPVDCASPHSVETTGQLKIPGALASAGYRSKRLRAWGARQCHAVTIGYVWGGSGADPKPVAADPRTAITAWFLPTRAEWRDGQRWISCAGVAVDPQWRITVRSGSVVGVGLRPSQCVDSRTWQPMDCRVRPSIALTYQVWIADRMAEGYPGARQALRRGEHACRRLGGRRADVVAWYVPGSSAWASGEKWAYCALQTV